MNAKLPFAVCIGLSCVAHALLIMFVAACLKQNGATTHSSAIMKLTVRLLPPAVRDKTVDSLTASRSASSPQTASPHRGKRAHAETVDYDRHEISHRMPPPQRKDEAIAKIDDAPAYPDAVEPATVSGVALPRIGFASTGRNSALPSPDELAQQINYQRMMAMQAQQVRGMQMQRLAGESDRSNGNLQYKAESAEDKCGFKMDDEKNPGCERKSEPR